jgi:hypothetical protein
MYNCDSHAEHVRRVKRSKVASVWKLADYEKQIQLIWCSLTADAGPPGPARIVVSIYLICICFDGNTVHIPPPFQPTIWRLFVTAQVVYDLNCQAKCSLKPWDEWRKRPWELGLNTACSAVQQRSDLHPLYLICNNVAKIVTIMKSEGYKMYFTRLHSSGFLARAVTFNK